MEVRTYTAFGSPVDNTVSMARTGYAGSVGESDLPWYLLGLRFYVPWLRRFIGPDAASPFGSGGFNRYAYCSGDPINHIDPSGNASFGWLGKLLGNLMGAVGNMAHTVAQATPTNALMAISSVAQTLSVVTSIGAVTAAMLDEGPTAEMLGWVAGGSGLAGLGLGVAGRALYKGKRADMRSASIERVGSATTRGELRGNFKTWSAMVLKSTFDDPGNRGVANYKGSGLRKMSALRNRLGPAGGGEPFTIEPDTVTWFNDNGGEVVGYDSRVRNHHIVRLMSGIDAGNEASGRRVRVFVGAHGNPSGHGDNWRGGRYRREFQIPGDVASVERQFEQAGLSSRIDVYDMTELTEARFMRKLTKDDAINVLAWCFSAADEKANQARMSLGGAEPFYRYRTYDHPTTV